MTARIIKTIANIFVHQRSLRVSFSFKPIETVKFCQKWAIIVKQWYFPLMENQFLLMEIQLSITQFAIMKHEHSFDSDIIVGYSVFK